MSSASDTTDQSSKTVVVWVLGIIGALGVIMGIVYLAVPAGSLPALFGSQTPANGHHTVRMATSFVVGIACLVAAWYVHRGSKK